jgi:uncharacterized protein
MKQKGSSRRQFLQQTAAGLTIAGITGRNGTASGSSVLGRRGESQPLIGPYVSGPRATELAELNTLKSFHIWDGHCHLADFNGSTPAERMTHMVRFADRMGVEKMCVFLGMTLNFHVGLEGMRKQNDELVDALQYSNGRALGYAYMDPFYGVQGCLQELNRCVRDGPMVGLKFEYDTPRHANERPGAISYGEPRDLSFLDPIIQRAGELHAVIMHHTWINTLGPEDIAESTPMEIAALARRHPSVTIICGHTGGNWELGIRAIRDVKNVYADLCGSDPTAGYTEMAVRELGPERVMYGSDIGGRGFASQIGKVMGANLTDSTRRLILGGNLRRVLSPILKAKGMDI